MQAHRPKNSNSFFPGRAMAMPASGHQLAARRTLHSVRCPADTHTLANTFDGQTPNIQWRAAPTGPTRLGTPEGKANVRETPAKSRRVHYRAAIHASHATERQVRQWYIHGEGSSGDRIHIAATDPMARLVDGRSFVRVDCWSL